MKRGESGGTYVSAGVRRSHSNSKHALHNVGFDLSYNPEAAAHKIGVNLIRKKKTLLVL